MTIRLVLVWLGAFTLGGCPRDPTDGKPAGGDSSGEDSEPVTGDTARDTAGGGPCGDGGWGLITDPDASIHVSETGDDANPGTSDAPLATLDAAFAMALAGDVKRVAVWPGHTYRMNERVGPDPGDGTTWAGFTLEGCGVDEVTVRADDDAESVLRVSAVSDVRIAGLSFEGGTQSLWLWDGTTATLENVEVREGALVGVVVDGPITIVDATDVTVLDTAEGTALDGSAIGIGLAVTDAHVTIDELDVERSVGIGVIVSGNSALVTLTNPIVADTAPDGTDALGRGVQVQDWGGLAISGGAITDNSDAGVYAQLADTLTLDGVEITGVATGTVPDEATASTGDGLVVSGIDADLHSYDPALFQTTLSGLEVSDFVRLGIFVENVAATMDGNTALDTTGASSLNRDSNATVTGGDATSVQEISGTELYRFSIDASVFVAGG